VVASVGTQSVKGRAWVTVVVSDTGLGIAAGELPLACF
jgi:signal transduction histidine kinase